jgi:two-component sensor histidine kinase
VAAAASEVAATDLPVKMSREGTFGVLPAEIATSLVMVLNELLINAVEHGFPASEFPPGESPVGESPIGESPADEAPAAGPGEVVVAVHRFRKQLHVTVADNGRGLPDGFKADSSGRLGLQIVRALATGELRGTIELRSRAGGGTEAVLVVPLGKRSRMVE